MLFFINKFKRGLIYLILLSFIINIALLTSFSLLNIYCYCKIFWVFDFSWSIALKTPIMLLINSWLILNYVALLYSISWSLKVSKGSQFLVNMGIFVESICDIVWESLFRNVFFFILTLPFSFFSTLLNYSTVSTVQTSESHWGWLKSFVQSPNSFWVSYCDFQTNISPFKCDGKELQLKWLILSLLTSVSTIKGWSIVYSTLSSIIITNPCIGYHCSNIRNRLLINIKQHIRSL